MPFGKCLLKLLAKDMKDDRLPVVPRLCFNWLPTYRYGLFAYKALQQICALRIKKKGEVLTLGTLLESQGLEFPLDRVRPVAIDTVLTDRGYLRRQFAEVLEPFSNEKLFYPLTEDMALIVVKEGQEGNDLLQNVIPYMSPAPHTLTASLAVAGDYSGVSELRLNEAHLQRKAAAQALKEELAKAYQWKAEKILLHLNAVGGLIEGTARYLHRSKPGFRTCSLTPEYWDFMRYMLTYSPEGLRLVPGRDEDEFPADAWLATLSQPENDFAYISFTSNPVGTTISQETFLAGLEAVPNDTLFFIDCTSVDIEERSSIEKLSTILKTFSHKNLLIAKSFSKEYELGDLRIGYAICTRQETADAIWPYMTGYPPELISKTALAALKTGNTGVLDRYRVANRLLQEMAKSYPRYRFTGDCSNYTLVFCDSADECVRMKELIAKTYGHELYPGEIPMQGGGDLGLSKGELDLTSMKNVPFLAPEALRLVVTPESIQAFQKLL